MHTLISFLRYGSTLDWLVVFLSLIVILSAIVLLVVLRSRTLFYPFLLVAMWPLLLGVASTYVKYRTMDRLTVIADYARPEVVERARQEARVSTYVGAVGTGAAMLIGLIGLALRKSERA